MTAVDPDDIPMRVVDQMGRQIHQHECGSFDGGTANRRVPPPWPYADKHREIDMRVAAVRLAQMLTDLHVPLDEFLRVVDYRKWETNAP